MKKATLVLMLIAALTACNQSAKKAENNETPKLETVFSADPAVVYVYYFHGKARCKTCIAVGDVSKATVEKNYAENSSIRFVEIDTSNETNKTIVEKYEVTWNALIIAKGENTIEITKQAFATAVGNPQELENLIKEEVNKRLN